MKKILCLFAILFSVSLVSCGDGGSSDPDDPMPPVNPKPVNSSEKFGITGISMSIKAAGAPAHIIMKDSPDEGAYVTWETWIENSIWTLPYQPGSYTAWDIQTPANGGDNASQIVGMAKTCIITDIDNLTGTENIYCGYYGGDTFYLAVRGTLHLPDGSTASSEYRQSIPITTELYDYINYEVMGQNESTFADRLTLSLTYTINPASL